MAEEQAKGNESSGCGGMFDVFKKKDEAKPQEYVTMADVEVKEKEEEKKSTLVEKLHRSDSNSSLSSEEEVIGENGEKIKKKKKKGIKETIKEKISGEKEENPKNKETSHPVEIPEEENPKNKETSHPVEIPEAEAATANPTEEKKGLLDKIKEKLPGQHKNPEENTTVTASCDCGVHHKDDDKEKKGIFDKIMEKLPGGHHNEDEKKPKET